MFAVDLPAGGLLASEVKASSSPGWNNVRGLHALTDGYADRVLGGSCGTGTYRLTDRIIATPWWRVI